MNTTFQNSAQVLSIGIFFTLMILGLAPSLPASALPRAASPRASRGRGRPRGRTCRRCRRLFAAFLGYNPIAAPARRRVLSQLPAAQRLPHRPQLLPLAHRRAVPPGLHAAFDFAVVACLVAAGASWLRGGKYVYTEPETPAVSAQVVDDDRESVVPVPILQTEATR